MLRELGRRFVRFVLSDRAIAIHRIVAAENGRFPEVGRMFYEQGPKRTCEHAAAFLAARMTEGRLRRADPERAAQHLFALLKSGVHQMCLWGVAPPPKGVDIEAHVTAAVDTFLHGYAHD